MTEQQTDSTVTPLSGQIDYLRSIAELCAAIALGLGIPWLILCGRENLDAHMGQAQFKIGLAAAAFYLPVLAYQIIRLWARIFLPGRAERITLLFPVIFVLSVAVYPVGEFLGTRELAIKEAAIFDGLIANIHSLERSGGYPSGDLKQFLDDALMLHTSSDFYRGLEVESNGKEVLVDSWSSSEWACRAIVDHLAGSLSEGRITRLYIGDLQVEPRDGHDVPYTQRCHAYGNRVQFTVPIGARRPYTPSPTHSSPLSSTAHTYTV